MESDEDPPAWLKLPYRVLQKRWKDFVEGRRREMPDHFASVYRDVMGRFEAEWNATQNPLWVWRAVEFAWSRTGSLDLPLPAWCVRYLAEVAHHLVSEALKINERVNPIAFPSAGGAPRADGRPHPPHDNRDPLPSAGELNDMVLRALGLRREGWNAFSAYTTDQQHKKLRRRFSQLLAEGLSRRAARDTILRETGRSDERELRRLLRDVKAPASSTGKGETES